MEITYDCTHVLDEAKRTDLFQDPALARKICRAIRSSQKFSVADNGQILGLGVEAVRKALDEVPIRLPYDAVALEFMAVDESNADKIVLVMEQVGDDIFVNRVHNRAFAGRHKKVWVADNGTYVLKNVSSPGKNEGGYFLGEIHEGNRDYYIGMLNEIIGTVVEFCCALSCSNVDFKDTVQPSQQLNRARSKKGLTEFFSYHVLTVGGGSHGSSSGGGTHASPRVHLRRGHIRRLPDKRVWVNACVVGDKSLGMVVKDYAVH